MNEHLYSSFLFFSTLTLTVVAVTCSEYSGVHTVYHSFCKLRRDTLLWLLKMSSTYDFTMCDVDESAVANSSGFGWDTRPRYSSSNTLTGNWFENRSNQPLLGGVNTDDGHDWTTETRASFSPHRVDNSSQMRQSLLFKATMDGNSRFDHMSIRSSTSSTSPSSPSSLNSSIRSNGLLPKLTATSQITSPRSVNRGKILYPHGRRAYCRHSGKWVPEPVDVQLTEIGHNSFTSTVDRHRRSSKSFSPFSTTSRSAFKEHSLPSLSKSQYCRRETPLTKTAFRASVGRK
eukprot:m.29419 g.29419  ORF g.29419 m.29419 type:complete len:288 (-) comp9573_c0_seq1:74-937(-)